MSITLDQICRWTLESRSRQLIRTRVAFKALVIEIYRRRDVCATCGHEITVAVFARPDFTGVIPKGMSRDEFAYGCDDLSKYEMFTVCSKPRAEKCLSSPTDCSYEPTYGSYSVIYHMMDVWAFHTGKMLTAYGDPRVY